MHQSCRQPEPQAQNAKQKDSTCFLQSLAYTVFDYWLMAFYFFIKIILTPFTFVVHVATSLVQLVFKIIRLGLTFVMNGIQGVQKMLKIGTFAEKIHYAVLKENGQYLRLANRTLEEVFTCQLYDYGIRKFMSISQLDEDAKVTQIQFWSTVGLNFIKQKFKVHSVSGLTNSSEKISRFRPKMKDIELQCSDYSSESHAQPQDIFIFFNRSREHEQHKLQIDMIKVLGYIKKNLNEGGYAVIGNYFNCDGDMAVFEQILEGFGFRIEIKQDITPNITHSRRVLARIHKNRKLAWAVGKAKQFVQLAFEHDNLLSNAVRTVWRVLQELSGIKTGDCKYNLYILEHA